MATSYTLLNFVYLTIILIIMISLSSSPLNAKENIKALTLRTITQLYATWIRYAQLRFTLTISVMFHQNATISLRELGRTRFGDILEETSKSNSFSFHYNALQLLFWLSEHLGRFPHKQPRMYFDGLHVRIIYIYYAAATIEHVVLNGFVWQLFAFFVPNKSNSF